MRHAMRPLSLLLVILALSPAARAADAGLPVTASSVYGDDYLARFALDGDRATRWASASFANRPEWLQIDFGQPVPLDALTIHWEAAYAAEYEIQVSDDAKTWKTLRHITDGKGGSAALTGLGGQGRYLRILCRKPGPFALFSIWELDLPEARVKERLAAAARQAEEAARQAARDAGRQMRERLAAQGVAEIVFAARPVIGEHWYANFGTYASTMNPADASAPAPGVAPGNLYREGGKLYRYTLATGQLVALLDDPKGGVRDPQVDYTGTKVLFAYRPGGTAYYHLYELPLAAPGAAAPGTQPADRAALRQLTDGPFDDFEPTYLPDGGIAFVSSRARRWVNCWASQVAIVFRCDGDGTNLRQLSANIEHDNTPWPLPDGRLLYTRWEYVDRSQVSYHHLWAMNPDGTGQTVYYGNLRPGTLMIDAKPIPGTQHVVAMFSPGHGQTEHMGRITVVDPTAGPDEARAVKYITREADFRDPWAFGEDLFLAAREASLVLVDGEGHVGEVLALPEADRKAQFWLHEPRPVLARAREPVIAPHVDAKQPTARLLLADVYAGRNLAGVKPGEIKKLLVLESLPKPINFTGGMEPLSFGGTFTLERVLGTVPVEADGSAYFELPALRPVLFVALDKDDLAVKRMQSFTSAEPGEVAGCVGCHEERTHTAYPPHSRLAALARPPSRIAPIAGVPDVFDFPRDIQPILDRHCVKCHDYAKPDGGVILTGDHGPLYSHSYFTLTVTNQVSDGRNRAQSNYPPRALGSAASPLLKKLAGGHYGASATSAERQIVRLWIDVGAPYPGTYAALGCGMIGGFLRNNLDRAPLDWPSTKAAVAAVGRRCAGCHVGDRALPVSVVDESPRMPWDELSASDPRRHYSRHRLYNLTRPEQSLLLLAPLAKAAGGYGWCGKPAAPALAPATQPAEVFTSTGDPDYAAILAAIAEAKAKLEQIKRFDMPGFRPRPEWVREMQRFGVLPKDLPPDTLIDPYAVERRYWKSLWVK